MSSFSGRAVTSIPASEASTPAATDTDSSGVDNSEAAALMQDVFVPHVFDFVSMARKAGTMVKSRIPSLFFESLAVDQSIIIGDGASFSAFRKTIISPPIWSETRNMDGLVITILPKYVVYKVARVAFTDIGQPTPETRQAMKAAMMEIFALVHPPLLKHPNIVDFLGLAWGSNYYNPSHRMPVLVVEYAEHGNLAQLQERENLEPSMRSTMALDIGAGLQVLHQCGIVHGDVKSENVLVFSHPEKKYLAKVADFGFSLVGEATDTEVYMGGTRPWKAPETKKRLAKHLLKATDIYSYGLLLWRLATDGKDPFRFLVTSELKGDKYMELLEIYKGMDGPAKNTVIEKWFLPYIVAEQKSFQKVVTLDDLAQVLPSLCLLATMTNSAQSTSQTLNDMYSVLKDVLRGCIAASIPTDTICKILLIWARQNSFYSRLPAALSKCITLAPHERDLEATLSALRGDTSTEAIVEVSIRDEGTLLKTSYDHHLLSWLQMKIMRPSVQCFLFERFLAKEQKCSSYGLINAPECFILASYYINAYGTRHDFKEAMRLLVLTSKKRFDHWPSRAYAYRICKAFDKNFTPDEELKLALYDSAFAGSRTALKDLQQVDPNKYTSLRILLRDVLAGVGANFFYPDQMLHGFTYWQWMATFDNSEIMVKKLGKLNRITEYKVNKRGDGILHLAASAGKISAIKELLNSFPLLIDQMNDTGETPLLCACRAGQVETVLEILKIGGDASITTPVGESPLHWLISFEDTQIETIARALLTAGANIRECNRTKVAYSIFPSGIVVDHERPGTPLAWAVQNNRPHIVKVLLEETQDASLCVFYLKDIPESPPPMELAAFCHNKECLQLMVEAMERAKFGFTFNPLLYVAAQGSDTFSMILRHGSDFKEKLNSTLDYLVRESKNAIFGTGIGGFGATLLYAAVGSAHDHVVEYLFSPRVEESLGPFEEEGPLSHKGAFHPTDIECPCGSARRTPLLEAVRWNRGHLVDQLLEHGANPKAKGRHPYARDEMNWTALHILADAGHNSDISLASRLVNSGLHVDGLPEIPEIGDGEEVGQQPSPMDTTETPFLVAMQNNAFNLATELVLLGADINALSLGSGFMTLEYPTTVLGHLVAASSQHTTPRLRYLLQKCNKNSQLEFIVEPARNLTALHRAAWANTGIFHRSHNENDAKILSREEYDMVVNREILIELLEKWNSAKDMDCRCAVDDKTALHLAVEAGNVEAVRLLLDWGAERMIQDANSLTPLEYAMALYADKGDAPTGEEELHAIIALLQ
ncbi:Serine/threonine-protein kinase HT1 [Lachnellula arida]|uniref:Serine/threonine-protein kinase HT1 n=1 Tax=Lachnellula arida TaxID=1316785 RepID=A0A8T9BB06_9HELO|nr:Serine/threonine-protein kinase HT1 [Lachnellula arida]